MESKDLKIDRILLFIGSIIYFVWGQVFLSFNENFYDPLFIRIIISSLILAVFISTFISEFVRKHLIFINYCIIYLVTFQQVNLIAINDLSSEYFIGFIIINVSLNAYFNKIRQLIFYSISTVLAVIVAFYIMSDLSSNKFVFFISSTLTINLFLTVLYGIRIKNQDNLRKYALELIDSEEKFKQLLESAPDAMIIMNEKGEIVKINRQAEKLFEFKESELLSKKFELIIPKNNQKYLNCENKNLDEIEFPETSGTELELSGLTKNNKEFPLELSLSPIKQKDGTKIIVAAIRDLTLKKKAELELLEVKELLKAQEIKEKISEGKSEFISKMSHEIRTPLNGVFGFTDLLLKENLNEKQVKYVNSLKFSCDILLTFINDILDFAKFETKSIVLEEQNVDLKNLIDDIVYIFNNSINDKKIKITRNYKNTTNLILGDKNRISQIVMNLLSNAIKFSPQGGEIIISLESKDLENNLKEIKIQVQDFGIGISEDKRQIIFEPFIQGDKHIAKNYGGTGLGLSIVKHLVQLMNGEINLESEINKGSLFTLNIPFREFDPTISCVYAPLDSSVSREKVSNLDSQNKDYKILLVEDNLTNQFLVESILENHGYKIDIANNGVEAAQRLSEKDYNLILMDLMMPIMDGYQTTEYIRKTLKLDVPIVILTADVKALAFDKISAEGIDFDAYLKKPFEVDELISTIIKFQNNGKL